MARSSYIYVVTEVDSSIPMAAFTVKHELASWLEKCPATVLGECRIFRLADNPIDPALAVRLGMQPSPPRELGVGEILSGKPIRPRQQDVPVHLSESQRTPALDAHLTTER